MRIGMGSSWKFVRFTCSATVPDSPTGDAAVAELSEAKIV